MRLQPNQNLIQSGSTTGTSGVWSGAAVGKGPAGCHSYLFFVAKHAGLGVSIYFHTARHSFATLMVSQNVDIYTVSKLLGHKDIATTQIYAKVLDEKKKEAIDRLPMIGV